MRHAVDAGIAAGSLSTRKRKLLVLMAVPRLEGQALKEVVAWQLAGAMKKTEISKNKIGHAPKDKPYTG